MNYIFKKEEGKATTLSCCGGIISIQTAILIVVILNCIGLVSAIAHLNPFQIYRQIFILVPLLCLAICNKSYLCRSVNMWMQVVYLVGILFSICFYLWAIDTLDVPTSRC